MADVKMVKVTVDGKKVSVPSTATVLEAAKVAGVDIPRLCFLKGINENSSCRLCVVEIEGIRTLKNSCTVQVNDGMVVKTNTPRVLKAVKTNLELIAGNHRFECWKCPREHNCELLRLLRKFNIENKIGESNDFSKKECITNISEALVIDSSKCVLCGRCIAACQKQAGTAVLDFNFRGSKTYVGPALNYPMEGAGCIFCGKCIQACPTGALKEKDGIVKAQSFVDDPELYTVACVAPAVRSAIDEEFGYGFGHNGEGKIFAALKKLGVDDFTDVNFAADVTIMEEGYELIHRVEKHLKGEDVAFPMFTSCSPGWVRYLETYYPQYIPNLSTTKSPQQIQGILIKKYYAQKIGVDPTKVRVISIMPCSCKKYEASREEFRTELGPDIDVVLTTRELARWIKRNEIDYTKLRNYTPKSPMAKYTGAAVIFGATGGVMEAALRTVKDVLEQKNNTQVDITPVRGLEDIKEATIKIAGKDYTFAVVHGAVNVPEMIRRIEANPGKYLFVEFMGCTGGCVNGGGQPIVPSYIADYVDVRAERAKVLYQIDKDAPLRKSHENPFVLDLYKEFLGEPNSELAHHLLHTHYIPRKKYSLSKEEIAAKRAQK